MFKNILCPVDFSKYSDIIVNYALELAKSFEAHIYLTHAIEILLPDPEYTTAFTDFDRLYDDLQKNANKQLEKIKNHIVQKNISVFSNVTIGKPFVEIIKYAKSIPADLIIIGTHGTSALSHILFGSTADKVVRKSPCPVLIVKHPDHSFVMP